MRDGFPIFLGQQIDFSEVHLFSGIAFVQVHQNSFPVAERFEVPNHYVVLLWIIQYPLAQLVPVVKTPRVIIRKEELVLAIVVLVYLMKGFVDNPVFKKSKVPSLEVLAFVADSVPDTEPR